MIDNCFPVVADQLPWSPIIISVTYSSALFPSKGSILGFQNFRKNTTYNNKNINSEIKRSILRNFDSEIITKDTALGPGKKKDLLSLSLLYGLRINNSQRHARRKMKEFSMQLCYYGILCICCVVSPSLPSPLVISFDNIEHDDNHLVLVPTSDNKACRRSDGTAL